MDNIAPGHWVYRICAGFRRGGEGIIDERARKARTETSLIIYMRKGRIRIIGKNKLRAAAALLLALTLAGSADAAFAETAPAALNVKTLVPVGRTAGIKILAGGCVIVGTTAIQTESGEVYPAEDAGLQPGDVVTEMNGVKLETVADMVEITGKNCDKPVKMRVKRGDRELSLTVTPRRDSSDGSVRIGASVRDSMAGIGTITFYDPSSGVFGALGHGISESGGELMPLGSGCLVPSKIVGVKKGEAGKPGELIGTFDASADAGSLTANTETGLYGTLKADELYPELLAGKALPVAEYSQISKGKAYILANIDGDAVKEYEIEIVKVGDYNKSTNNMQIRITDRVLLSKTGGIVQGMSGSPIIQDGRLIGAVTHVLVNDPTLGYGIYIGNMLAGVGEQGGAESVELTAA